VRGPRHVVPARLAAPVLVASAVGAATALLAVVDPAVPGRYPPCPWHALTGLYCPGCGGLRAVHALTRGDIALAASSNVLVVAAVPVAVLAYLWWLRRRWLGPRARGPLPVAVTYWAVGVGCAVLVTFGVLRNLPGLTWLAP
jgi:hypothetical protein